MRLRRLAAIAAAAPAARTASEAGSGTDWEPPPPPPGAGGHQEGTTLQVAPACAASLAKVNVTAPTSTSNDQMMFLTTRRTPTIDRYLEEMQGLRQLSQAIDP